MLVAIGIPDEMWQEIEELRLEASQHFPNRNINHAIIIKSLLASALNHRRNETNSETWLNRLSDWFKKKTGYVTRRDITKLHEASQAEQSGFDEFASNASGQMVGSVEDSCGEPA